MTGKRFYAMGPNNNYGSEWSGGTQQTPPEVAEGSARTAQPETIFVASEATDSFPTGLGYNFWAMDPDNHNCGSNPQESTTSDEIEMISDIKTDATIAANATMTEKNVEQVQLNCNEDKEESHHQIEKMEPEWNQSKMERTCERDGHHLVLSLNEQAMRHRPGRQKSQEAL